MMPSARTKSQRGIRRSDAPRRRSNNKPIEDAALQSMIVANYTELIWVIALGELLHAASKFCLDSLRIRSLLSDMVKRLRQYLQAISRSVRSSSLWPEWALAITFSPSQWHSIYRTFTLWFGMPGR